MIKRENILKEFILNIILIRKKEYLKYDYDSSDEDCVEDLKEFEIAIDFLNNIDYSKLDLSKIISSAVFSGDSDYYIHLNSISYLIEGYIPILYRNELEGRNITKEHYMITFLKFEE